MPTLTTLIFDNLTIEVEYNAIPGEEMIKHGPNANPGCDTEIEFVNIYAVIDDAREEIWLDNVVIDTGPNARGHATYESVFSILSTQCLEHYAAECKEAADERHSNP